MFYINKNMVDKAHKDKKCKQYDRNFAIQVQMTKIDESRVAFQSQELKPFKTKAKQDNKKGTSASKPEV